MKNIYFFQAKPFKPLIKVDSFQFPKNENNRDKSSLIIMPTKITVKLKHHILFPHNTININRVTRQTVNFSFKISIYTEKRFNLKNLG